MVPGQVNKGKMRGRGAFGYGAAEVMEVDPVSHTFLQGSRWILMIRT
jgi:hypothetical protein